MLKLLREIIIVLGLPVLLAFVLLAVFIEWLIGERE